MIKGYLLGYSTCILIFMLFISGCAGTQDLAPDGSKIPIGTNTIIANSELDRQSAYQDIGQFLIQRGFTINSTSPEFYSLETNFKETSRGAGILNSPLEMAINVSVIESNEGSQIAFNGEYLSESLNISDGIEQVGQSGSVTRITWDEFYNLAKSYSDSLSFEIR